MTAAAVVASSGVVLSNLAYVIGALVLAVILSGLVAWRHRRPRSVESNMESFHRGLRALAPEASADRRRSVTGMSPQPTPRSHAVRTVTPSDDDRPPGPEQEAQTG